MTSRYYSEKSDKKDIAGLATGTAATVGGGALLFKSLKKKKGKKAVEEVVEVIKEKKGSGTPIGKGASAARSHLGNWSGGSWFSSELGNRATRIGSRYARKFHSDIENNDENMEIRRKVFSIAEDENGEERYYSTTEFSLYDESYDYDEEKLFSTGDPDLDDILEEVYYSGLEDGYDYAYEEREYAEKEDNESGTGVAAAGAASAGGVYGIGKLRSKKVIKKAAEEARSKTAEAGKAAGNIVKSAGEQAEKHIADVAEKQMLAERNAGSFVGELAEKIGKKKRAKEAQRVAEGMRAEGKKKAGEVISKAVKESKGIKEAAEKKASSIGKKSKIGAAAVLGTSGLIAAGKAIKNSKKSE